MTSTAAWLHWRPRFFITLPLVACLAFGVACNRGGNPAPNTTATNDTPRGATQPRTSPPLPPVSAAHWPGGARPAMDVTRTTAQSWTTLDGRRVRATDFKGKVLVLDFWATYCPPCRDEVPHLNALQQRYAAQGLNIVGLHVGGGDDRPKWRTSSRS